MVDNHSIDLPFKRYGPIGQCIYCGDLDLDHLRDEHIIPFAFHGDLVLTKSTCIACASVTGGVEQRIARTMMGHFRIGMQMQTRKPNDRPTFLPLDVEYHDGRKETISIPSSDHPGLTTQIHFDLPSMMTGSNSDDRAIKITTWQAKSLDLTKYPNVKSYTGELQAPFAHFARMIAKIAHCDATLRLGVDGFEPDLSSIILGTNDDWHRHVGGEIEPLPPIEAPQHQLSLQIKPIEGHPMVISRIRLFANFNNSPTYYTVVGRSNDLSFARFELPVYYPEDRLRRADKTRAGDRSSRSSRDQG